VAPPAALQLSNGTLDHSNLSKNTCRHCNLPFSHAHGLTHHVRNAHTELFECQDCHESFSVTEHLNQHARQAKHQAFRCSASGCITRFTRLDDLHRHMRRHRPDAPQFACTLCPQKNFGRKDHLTQHMRNWHRVDQLPGTSTSSRSCPHPWCPRFREPDGTSLAPLPFNQSKDYIHHMRHEHNESPFPCLESGCDKIEGNGYFREMDLVKHRRKTHAHTEVMGGEG
jgi:hypothetical protein